MFASSTGPAVSGGGTSDADIVSLVSISPPFASSTGPAVSGGGTASELFSVG